VLGEDEALIEFLQKAIGYSLTGRVNEKALFFLHGTGDNGKTTLIEAVRKIMGEYAGTVDIDALMKKSGVPEKERAIADLLGKRFVTSSEAAEGEALHEARIKNLTGMGRLSGRRIYGSAFEFDPQFKLFIDANHKPHISGTEGAIWSRFKLIPFNVSIPKAEQDKHLLEKLAAEAPGILAWAVQGCLTLLTW
jgi:putative DNA primase/helicase